MKEIFLLATSRARRRLTGAAVLTLLFAPLTVVTLTAAPAHAAPVEVTIVGTNDFHGRLLPDRGIPGAAEYAGAVDSIRADNPNTVFAAAGDLIGATTFESFINQDKPTIDILNAMGLDVSAVGNHELDQGYADLVDRVMAPESDANPQGGADWEYVAANIEEPGGADEIAESWTVDMAGVTVGFVGAVTEALPSLVAPAGIEGLTVTDVAQATNAEADALKAAGADVVVLLVHEGASSTSCTDIAASDPSSAFGSIVHGVDADVDAIISGHTHLPYSCTIGGRPVVSAGQYGSHLNRLDFTVDDVTGQVLSVTPTLLDLNQGDFGTDATVQGLVDEAVAAAEGPGSVALGDITAPVSRAQWLRPNASGDLARSENRGGESTLGNLVAEVQRWATASPERGGAQIAFMNPGGLRDDMLGTAADGFPETVTYRQAANVQPFANTLVNMRMTGEQVRAVLEEQWQPAGASRPFLRLGTSEGFEYSYDPTAAPGERIGAIWLHGSEIQEDATYSVTANSFLASGGDNFGTFAQATDKRDSGMVDLQAMVDYLAATDGALEPDFAQRAVGVRFPDGATAPAGGSLRLELSSLAMTNADDIQDDRVLVKLGNRAVGGAEVDNTLQVAGSSTEQGGFDEAGTATVVARIPKKAARGLTHLEVFAPATGTSVLVPVHIS